MVKGILSSLLLLFSINAAAVVKDSWVFYQPQLRDSSVTTAQWQGLLSELKQSGAKGIVLQWTAYGERGDLSVKQNRQLEQVFILAEQMHLKVIIGLYSDPDFFSSIKQPAASLKYYLHKQKVLSLKQVQQWLKYVNSTAFSGWYLTEEIDDYHWQDEDKKSLLIKHLTSIKDEILKLTPEQPIYISAYIGGYQSASHVSDLFSAISLQGQLNVLLQDGFGTQALTAEQKKYYFSSLLSCDNSTVSGTVFEYFRQQKDTEVFKANPPSQAQWQRQLNSMSTYCHGEKVIFSLRYLPYAQGILDSKSD
ncbi:DUF4434 domain-containing protein [Moritella sp. Urea-trap-13]|uniref:DUF4434 domain-containing protein n=1 Tax=Moritella sp. Urea-trap-13 TaxID=2058327 RepID=UPI000C33A5DD|nr:DUF4434 domain-containing protein [Moritella sp. Urea-trap-13]PKH06946.1 hypothetical protein CXF93_13775 [Moritella sp. Urea-trap-13]